RRPGFDLSVCTPFSVSVVSIRYVGITPPRSWLVRAYTGCLVAVEDRPADEEKRAERDPGERRGGRRGIVGQGAKQVADNAAAEHHAAPEGPQATEGVCKIGAAQTERASE